MCPRPARNSKPGDHQLFGFTPPVLAAAGARPRYDDRVDDVHDRMELAWSEARGGIDTHGLVLPGSPAFVCQADLCDAWCCRNLTVALDDADAARLERETGRAQRTFLESERGVPIALPLAQPYVLGRCDGACVFLAGDRRCGAYSGRPDACRLYPHSILFVDAETGRPLALSAPDRRAAVEGALHGEQSEALPLLLRHLACPGFTGPPLDVPAWRSLLAETYSLQFRELVMA